PPRSPGSGCRTSWRRRPRRACRRSACVTRRGGPWATQYASSLGASMRIAALDLGSNSFHLLVADVHPDGTFESITREKDMLRPGDEVARHARINDTHRTAL